MRGLDSAQQLQMRGTRVQYRQESESRAQQAASSHSNKDHLGQQNRSASGDQKARRAQSRGQPLLPARHAEYPRRKSTASFLSRIGLNLLAVNHFSTHWLIRATDL